MALSRSGHTRSDRLNGDPLDLDVELEIDLAIDIDGRQCDVWVDGTLLVVNASSLRTARSVLKGVQMLPVGNQRVLNELIPAGVTVEVRVRHEPVAWVGEGVRPSPLSRAIGFEGEVSPRGMLIAAWRSLG